MQAAERLPRRIVRNGVPSKDLVLSVTVGSNEDLFPHVLGLYVAPGSIVADVTYGQGVFWRSIPLDRYRLLATDITKGVDSRVPPYSDGEIDCVVFDLPCMHSPCGSAHRIHKPFENYYWNSTTGNRTASKYHDAVLELYADTGKEA